MIEGKGLPAQAPEALAAFWCTVSVNCPCSRLGFHLSHFAVPAYWCVGHSLFSINSFFLYYFSLQNTAVPHSKCVRVGQRDKRASPASSFGFLGAPPPGSSHSKKDCCRACCRARTHDLQTNDDSPSRNAFVAVGRWQCGGFWQCAYVRVLRVPHSSDCLPDGPQQVLSSVEVAGSVRVTVRSRSRCSFSAFRCNRKARAVEMPFFFGLFQ
jgi:hypothetical protein